MILGSSLAVALLWLLIFDLVRPSHAPSIGMLVSRAWSHLVLLALMSLALFAASAGLRQSSVRPILTKRLRQAALGLGLLVAVPLGVMMTEACIYDPIKFTFLIWRVESARTTQEEKAAFRLAARWGRVWELHRIAKQEYLPPRARRLAGDSILELEWLEGWPTGPPFRAYRRVLDEQNLRIFDEERVANKSGRSNGITPSRSATNRTSSAADPRR